MCFHSQGRACWNTTAEQATLHGRSLPQSQQAAALQSGFQKKGWHAAESPANTPHYIHTPVPHGVLHWVYAAQAYQRRWGVAEPTGQPLWPLLPAALPPCSPSPPQMPQEQGPGTTQLCGLCHGRSPWGQAPLGPTNSSRKSERMVPVLHFMQLALFFPKPLPLSKEFTSSSKFWYLDGDIQVLSISAWPPRTSIWLFNKQNAVTATQKNIKARPHISASENVNIHLMECCLVWVFLVGWFSCFKISLSFSLPLRL